MSLTTLGLHSLAVQAGAGWRPASAPSRSNKARSPSKQSKSLGGASISARHCVGLSCVRGSTS
ncbi:hypothetical protein PR003_g1086 [Phytophthora rubi]|uniref:Uncharacterized protein n=1 Tax=Phytophthora rubi TaxID=129364 RepID=A0A6A4G972_9STRA|nr:hypothetical protein PR003_g1086 [Phytophthora rubi]